MLSILVLSAAVALACGLAVEKVHKSTEFDHYVFTEDYPPGLCYELESSDCSYPRNSSSWTIHGLWPTEGTTKGPNYCQNASFDPGVIQSILPLLVANWTNVYSKTGFYSFWEHEYLKHGTCSGMDEYAYFNKGLGLLYKVGSFGDVLQSKGSIVPGNQAMYDADKVRSVLASYYGVTPTLQCEKKNDSHVLIQIEICLTKDNFSPTECPDRDETDNCYNDQVLYPPRVN